MIIGLTGKNASGKGEVADYLKKKGFAYFSLSDILREEATKLNLEHSRDNLIKLGNKLRAERGPGFLAEGINKKLSDGNFVIDSIRSPFEVKELMKNENFLLVGIEAPIEIRFERLLERNRVGDAKTLEEFKQQEAKENIDNENNQQLDATFRLSQKIIENNSSLEELHKKIDDLLGE